MTLDDLNALPAAEAHAAFLKCCRSTRWAAAMAARRPFANPAELARAADDEWLHMARHDWLEAFAGHPTIGERATDSGSWSGQEQSGMRGASERTRHALELGNREYEQRFGHVFLVCATGRSADDMLDQLEARLHNEPDAELHIAAAEQAKITRLRLEKLLTTETARTR